MHTCYDAHTETYACMDTLKNIGKSLFRLVNSLIMYKA